MSSDAQWQHDYDRLAEVSLAEIRALSQQLVRTQIELDKARRWARRWKRAATHYRGVMRDGGAT